MAKKYMICENMDLIKKYDIPFIRATINNRCHRILCSCGALIEGTSHTCPETVDKKPFYTHLSDGYSTLVHTYENLLMEENVDELGNKEYKIYFPTLGINVDQYSGKLSLKDSKAYVASFNEESITIHSVKYGDRISVEKIKDIMSTVVDKKCGVFRYFQIAETLKLENTSNLFEYFRAIKQRGCSLFENEEFVKDHTQVINDMLLSSRYRKNDITDEDKLCEYFSIPKCLYRFTSDEYYNKTLKEHYYKEVVAFGGYPQRIIGWISYYMEIGRFTKASIAELMKEFNSEFFDSDLKIDCFVKFLVKNQYLGDKIFSAAKRIFRYLDDNNIELSENTLNSKYYYNMTNYKELCEHVGTVKADEFEYLRETSGIIVAMKRLLEE